MTGFGVRDSVSDIVGLQYGELNQYQLTLGLRDPSALEGRDLQAVLEDSSRIESSLAVMQQEMDIVPDEGRPADSLVVFVPQDVDALGPVSYTHLDVYKRQVVERISIFFTVPS